MSPTICIDLALRAFVIASLSCTIPRNLHQSPILILSPYLQRGVEGPELLNNVFKVIHQMIVKPGVASRRTGIWTSQECLPTLCSMSTQSSTWHCDQELLCSAREDSQWESEIFKSHKKSSSHLAFWDELHFVSITEVGQIPLTPMGTTPHPASYFSAVYNGDSWWQIGVSQGVHHANWETELVNPSYGQHCRSRGLPLRKHYSISWSLNSVIS